MSKTFDLTTLNLEAGEYEITVKAEADDYIDSEPSNSVSYVVAGDTVQVSGTWYFNAKIRTHKTKLSQDCSFSSNNFDFSNISVSATSGYIHYDNTPVTNYANMINGTWTFLDENYRRITFDGTQTVSKEFYDWLVANAVRQSITFTIDGTSYTALSGMTWDDWVDSEYNTDGFSIDFSGYVHLASSYYVHKNGVLVNPNETITSTAYTLEAVIMPT